jgi:hypothetical protein
MQTIKAPRRKVLGAIGCGAAATLLAGAVQDAAAASFAASDRRCATCDFWGGQRSLAADRRSVTTADGATGICNNPQSPLFNRQARADQVFPNGYQRWRELA